MAANNTVGPLRVALNSTNTFINNTFEERHFLNIPSISFPNGGETLSGVVTIQWQAATNSFGHAITHDLYYSQDDGISWTVISSGLTTTSFAWDTTTVPDGTYWIKVLADDGHGLIVEDVSDGTITINNADGTATSPTTTSKTQPSPTTSTSATTNENGSSTSSTTTPVASSISPGWNGLMPFLTLAIVSISLHFHSSQKKKRT